MDRVRDGNYCALEDCGAWLLQLTPQEIYVSWSGSWPSSTRRTLRESKRGASNCSFAENFRSSLAEKMNSSFVECVFRLRNECFSLISSSELFRIYLVQTGGRCWFKRVSIPFSFSTIFSPQSSGTFVLSIFALEKPYTQNEKDSAENLDLEIRRKVERKEHKVHRPIARS